MIAAILAVGVPAWTRVSTFSGSLRTALLQFAKLQFIVIALALGGCVSPVGPTATPETDMSVATIPSGIGGPCDHYVDNTAKDNGDGARNRPWKTIHDHVVELLPGKSVCVRGDSMLPGRVYTDYIHLEGGSAANGTAERPITLRAFPGEKVIIRSPDRPLLRFQEVAYWRVEGFVFDGEGHRGNIVEILGGAHHNVLRSCELTSAAGYGVRLEHGDYNLIENCRIHGFDRGPYDDAHGILLTDGTGNIMSHNEIYDATGDAIQLIHGSSQGTVIEGNHLYTTLGPCSENAIDIKDIGRGWSQPQQTVVRRNLMHGFRRNDGHCGGDGSGGVAVMVHFDADNILFEQNTIYDSNEGFIFQRKESSGNHSPDNIILRNNLIHNLYDEGQAEDGYGIYMGHVTNFQLYHNTFVAIPGPWLIVGPGVRDFDMYNNLVYNAGEWVKEAEFLSSTFDYNGWFNVHNPPRAPHDITGSDPLFVNEANRDYHLQEKSLAVNAGVVLSVMEDLDGKPRWDRRPDLGAYEFQPAPQQP